MQRLVWTPDLVTRFWDDVSSTRLMEMSFFRTGGRGLFSIIGHYFRPGASCLDIGAGDGDLAQWASDRGCKVALMEPSEKRQAAIREKPFASSPNFLGFIEPSSNDLFDIVIATEVIEHVLDEQMDDFLGALKKHIKPGGTLIITTPNEEDLELAMAYCPVSGTLFHRWQHVRSFSAESLATLLSGAGFRPIEVRRVDYSDYRLPRFFRWPLTLLRKLRSTNPPALVYIGAQGVA